MRLEQLLLLSAIPVLGVAAVCLCRYFSAEARLERRRRRSNSRIASKGKRPLVKFSVRIPKQKE